MPKFLSDGIFDGSSTDLIVDGKIGIGTATPTTALDVSGLATVSQSINVPLVYKSNTDLNLIGGGPQTDFSRSQIKLFNGGDVTINASSGRPVTINSGGSFAMVLDSAQQVGVGRTSPSSKLHIEDSISNGSLFKITTSTSGALQPVFDARISSNGDTYYDFNAYKSSTTKIQIKSANTSYIQQVDGTGGFDIKGHLKTSLQTVNGGGVLQLHRYGALSLNDDASYAHIPASALYINTLSNTSTDYLMLLANQGSDKLAVDLNGNVGIGTTSPNAKLHIDAPTGDFLKITESGTDRLTLDSNNELHLTAPSNFGGYFKVGKNVGAYEVALELGAGRTANGHSYIDLVGDATYTDYGFRIIRGNTGANTTSQLVHRGTGNFELISTDSGNIVLAPNSGNVGIATTSPNEKLTVAGQIQVTDSGTQARLNLNNTGTGDSQINFQLNNTSAFSLGVDNSDGDKFKITGGSGAIGSNDRFVIDSSGNVGIGTTSPSEKLEVNGNISVSGNINLTDGARIGLNAGDTLTIAKITGAGNANLTIDTETTVTSGFTINNATGLKFGSTSGANAIYANTGSTFEFSKNGGGLANYQFTSNVGSVTFLNANNVGIGTTNPLEKLHVVGNGIFEAPDTSLSYPIKIYTNKASGYDRTSGILFNTGYTNASRGKGALVYDYITSNQWNRGDFHFLQNTSANSSVASLADSVLTIKNSGNVGIGTTSPGQKLDVNGNIKMTETAATTDTDKFVVLDSGVLKYRTGSQLLSDIGGASGSDSLQLIDVSEPGNTTEEWSLIKTLPSSTTSTRDTLFIKVVGGAWNDHGRYEAEITLSNRDSFNYFWEVKSGDEYNGGTNGSNRLRVIAYSQTDGTVDVYLYKAGYVTGYIYATFQNTGGPEIITSLGSSATVQPSGTEVFNTHGETYSANISSVNGNVGINAAYPGKMLELRGGANEAAIRLRDTTSNVWDIQNSTDGKLDFIRGVSNTYMRINQVGNIGIGTTSPGKKLDVLGDIRSIDSSSNQHQLRATQVISYGTDAILNAQSSGDDVRLNTQSTTRLIATAEGNVGIGTTSPSAKLTVVDDILLTGSSPSLTLTDATSSFILKTNTAGEGVVQTSGTSKPIRFFRNNGSNESMRIDGAGNVGIGTTSPGHLLEVRGTADALSVGDDSNTNTYARFANDRTYFGYLSSGNAFVQGGATKGISFHTGSSTVGGGEKMRINASGNVGIGTTSPGDKLEVAGTVRFTDRLYTNANATTTVGILGKATANGWASRYDSNNSNFSGFYFDTNHQSIIIGRNSGGSIVNYIHANASSYFNGGNVGIGTTSPSEKLAVSGGNIEIADNTGGRKIGFDVSDSISFNSTTIAQYGMSNAGNSEAGGITYSGFFGQKFFTNSTQRMVIQRYGNVGIGTTSPVAKLEVEGSDHLLQVSTTSATGNPYISFNQAGTRRSFIQHHDSGDYLKLASEYGGISFFTGTGGTETQKMTILSGGNVGIGTTDPQKKLHVSSNDQTTARIRLSNTNTSSGGDNIDLVAGIPNVGQDGFSIYNATSNQTQFVILGTGNVGIGTDSPQEKLHVQNYTTGESHQAMFKGGAVAQNDYSYISLNNGYSTEYNKEVRLAAVAELSTSNKTGFAILTSPDSNGASGHERLRVTADGNVCIGATTPSAVGGTSKMTINAQGSPVSIINGATDGMYIKRYAAQGKYQIQTTYLGGNSGDLLLQSSGGNVGIGTTSPSQKLHVVGSIEVSDGVYIGGTATANKLDDYEEGTFTPNLTVTGTSTSISSKLGRYTKIGNLVHVEIHISKNVPEDQTTQIRNCTNLPFTILNTTFASFALGQLLNTSNFNTGRGLAYGLDNTTTVTFYDNGLYADLPGDESTEVTINITYKTS